MRALNPERRSNYRWCWPLSSTSISFFHQFKIIFKSLLNPSKVAPSTLPCSSPEGIENIKTVDVWKSKQPTATPMATPLDSVTILLAGLTTGNNCRATLEQLRVLLVSVSVQELKDYVPKIDVDRLFTCLTTTDRYFIWHLFIPESMQLISKML